MLFNMDSLYESSKQLLYYLTHLFGYNNFLVDEVDDELVRALRDAIISEDRVKAVQIYLRIDKDLDEIRNRHSYKNPELPYGSNFRRLAKEMYRELKVRHLINQDDMKHIAYILRFISSSDFYTTREMLVKKSHTFYNVYEMPLDPDSFYCKYIPIEAIMDYCVKMVCLYIKWR